MSDAEKTQEILDALIARSDRMIWASELAIGPKRGRIDFWTISPQQGSAYAATAYEIKVSKADFKRDTAEKQRLARLYSDEFFYVAPKGLLSPSDIPDWAGLQEWDGRRFAHTIHAPRRDKDAPSWELLTSIIRYSGQVHRDIDMMKTSLKKAEATTYRQVETIHALGNEKRALLKEIAILKKN